MDPYGVALSLFAGTGAFFYARHRQMMDGPDGHVLHHLKKAGSDLSSPHNVEFFFTSIDSAGLEAISSALSYRGYATSISQPDGDPASCLTASTCMPLHITTLLRLRKEFTSLALAHGVEYDGWGANVVPGVG